MTRTAQHIQTRNDSVEIAISNPDTTRRGQFSGPRLVRLNENGIDIERPAEQERNAGAGLVYHRSSVGR